MITVTIMKKKIRKLGRECLKTWVELFQAGIFQGGIHQGEVWLVEIFRMGVFLIPKKIYAKNSQVYMHWPWSSSEKSSFSKPIASVFIPAPIIFFSYGVEIFPHLVVQLIGHWPNWVHRDVNFSSYMLQKQPPEVFCKERCS